MADTDRRPLTLAVATWEYLDQLSKLGTHGTSVPDVAKTLIEEGIRQAIKDGFLKQRPAAGPSGGNSRHRRDIEENYFNEINVRWMTVNPLATPS